MPEQTVIAFCCIGFCFCLHQLFLWYKFIIRFPIIGANYPFGNVFDFIPKLLSGFCSSGTNFTVDKSVPISINSNPNPAVVFFEPIYVCISSNPTTSISCEFLNSSNFTPKLFIQLKAETWLTFKYLPNDRNPKPSKYKIRAFLLSSLDFPICSTVNRCLQTLQKYLCFDLTIPSFELSN